MLEIWVWFIRKSEEQTYEIVVTILGLNREINCIQKKNLRNKKRMGLKRISKYLKTNEKVELKFEQDKTFSCIPKAEIAESINIWESEDSEMQYKRIIEDSWSENEDISFF